MKFVPFSLLALALAAAGCAKDKPADAKDHVSRFTYRSYQTGSNIPRPSGGDPGLDIINSDATANGAAGGMSGMHGGSGAAAGGR